MSRNFPRPRTPSAVKVRRRRILLRQEPGGEKLNSKSIALEPKASTRIRPRATESRLFCERVKKRKKKQPSVALLCSSAHLSILARACQEQITGHCRNCTASDIRKRRVGGAGGGGILNPMKRPWLHGRNSRMTEIGEARAKRKEEEKTLITDARPGTLPAAPRLSLKRERKGKRGGDG